MTEQAIDQRAAFEGAIRQMAATNPAFRAELSSNPTEALKAAFGLDLPADFNLRVVNEKPGELVLVLPSPVRELNDDELDVVSGAGLFDVFNSIGRTSASGLSKVVRPK